jgi:hypothetical protein
MQKIIQIYPCLLKLSRKQESVTDGHYYYIPSPLSRGDNKMLVITIFCMWLVFSLSWMGAYMEIFEARVLEGNLSFWLKNHQF